MKKHEIPSKSTGYTGFIGAESTTPSQDAVEVFGPIMNPLKKYIEQSPHFLELSAVLLQTSSLFSNYFDRSLVFLRVRQQALLCLVVCSEQTKAEGLLKQAENTPERLQLLLCSTSPHPVTNPWGKRFTGMTALQIALCEGNVRMVKMLEKYFQKIPDGLEKMYRQMLKIFPGGFPDPCIALAPPHVITLSQKAQSFSEKFIKPCAIACLAASEAEVNKMLIKKHSPSSKLGEAIANFREAIKEESSKANAIHNNNYLREAIDVYFLSFHSYDSTEAQRQLFCIQVIGFVQRFSAGFYFEVLRYSSPPTSTLPLLLQDLAENPTSGLGFNYWVGMVKPFIRRPYLVKHFVAPRNAEEMLQMGMSDWDDLDSATVNTFMDLFNRCRPKIPEPVASFSAVTP